MTLFTCCCIFRVTKINKAWYLTVCDAHAMQARAPAVRPSQAATLWTPARPSCERGRSWSMLNS